MLTPRYTWHQTLQVESYTQGMFKSAQRQMRSSSAQMQSHNTPLEHQSSKCEAQLMSACQAVTVLQHIRDTVLLDCIPAHGSYVSNCSNPQSTGRLKSSALAHAFDMQKQTSMADEISHPHAKNSISAQLHSYLLN